MAPATATTTQARKKTAKAAHGRRTLTRPTRVPAVSYRMGPVVLTCSIKDCKFSGTEAPGLIEAEGKATRHERTRHQDGRLHRVLASRAITRQE